MTSVPLPGLQYWPRPPDRTAVDDHDYNGATGALFRFLGTEEVIRGIVGLLYDDPHGRPDSLQCRSTTTAPDVWFDMRLEDCWIPDALFGPMAAFMEAIQTDGTPLIDAVGTLHTLRLARAARHSAAEHRSVCPDES